MTTGSAGATGSAKATQHPVGTAGRSWARTGFLLTAWLFVGCLFVQIFLAGLGTFAGGSNFIVHRDFGYLFGLLTIVLIVLGLIARLPRLLVGVSALLLVLFAMQSFFVLMRTDAPAIAALHLVNGFLILLVAVWLALQARRFVAPPLGTSPDSA